MGMSRKRRCNLAYYVKKKEESSISVLSTAQHTLLSCLGPINSAFDGVGKSIHNVHPGLLNYNHLIIGNEIHEEHVAVSETNGEVTTRFDQSHCTRIQSLPLPS